MATFMAFRYSSTSNPDGFLLPTDPGVVYSENGPTHFVATGAYESLVFTGANFTFDSAGRPIGGTITAIDASSTYGLGPLYSLTGLSLAMADFLAAQTFDQTQTLMAQVLSGADILNGSPLSDSLYGFAGRDVIRGGDSSDYLFGGDGRDKINAGDGFDLVEGGRGRDKLNGGADIDTLSYADTSAAIEVVLRAASGRT